MELELETKLVGERHGKVAEPQAETGVDQWPVQTVDLRRLGLDNFTPLCVI